jgi:putative endonuclease
MIPLFSSFWSPDRRTSYLRGHVAEWIGAALLVVKGYRILGRRCRTRSGEIDLIAVRGRTIAFIEVKQRRSLLDAEAAITARQSLRLRRAASLWLADRPRYQSYDQRFDAIFVVPNQRPLHLPAGA